MSAVSLPGPDALDELAGRIRNLQHVDPGYGGATELLIKPVPDAVRPHALDPRAKAELAAKARSGSNGFSLRAMRRAVPADPCAASRGATVTERLIDVDGDHRIDVFVVQPENQRGGCGLLVHFHGGGFMNGSFDTQEAQMRAIASRSGCVVVFVEYRRAPECPFPGPVRDALAGVLWAREHAAEYGADPERIMLSGDSAGGSLVNACILQDREGVVKKAFEVYPSLDWRLAEDQDDYSWSLDMYDIVDDERELVAGALERTRRCREHVTGTPVDAYFYGGGDPADPLASAVCATDEQLARFPQMVIASAEYDYLRPIGEYAAERLNRLGVDVRQIRYEGCRHGFFDKFATSPQARELCWTIADELAAL